MHPSLLSLKDTPVPLTLLRVTEGPSGKKTSVKATIPMIVYCKRTAYECHERQEGKRACKGRTCLGQLSETGVES